MCYPSEDQWSVHKSCSVSEPHERSTNYLNIQYIIRANSDAACLMNILFIYLPHTHTHTRFCMSYHLFCMIHARLMSISDPPPPGASRLTSCVCSNSCRYSHSAAPSASRRHPVVRWLPSASTASSGRLRGGGRRGGAVQRPLRWRRSTVGAQELHRERFAPKNKLIPEMAATHSYFKYRLISTMKCNQVELLLLKVHYVVLGKRF